VVGFLCWGEEAGVVGFDYDDAWTDIGWGLRPDLTGRGLGRRFISDVAASVGSHLPRARLRATIAAFNVRCRKACTGAGFTEIARFTRPSDGMPFVVMMGGFPAAQASPPP
jgi:RimJ/RimL family protein N-acetyltransferase